MFTPRAARRAACALFLFLGLALPPLASPAAALNILSSASFNGSNDVNDYGNDVAVDASGNLYVTGSVGFGGSGKQLWLGKYSSSLVLLSSYTMTVESGEGEGVALAPGGDVYVVGRYNDASNGGDIWLGRFSPSLVLLSSATLGMAGQSDWGFDIAVSSAGHVFLVGMAATGVGTRGVWVARADTDLVIQSSAVYNGTNSYGRGIALGPSGDLFVAATLYGATSEETKAWVAKLDTNAALLSSAEISSPVGCGNGTEGEGLTVTSSGEVYLAGRLCSGGSQHAMTARYSPSLVLLATTTTAGASNFGIAYDVVATTSGDVVVVGFTDNTGSGADLWVAQYSSALVLRSSETAKSPSFGNDRGFGVALSASGTEVGVVGWSAPVSLTRDIWVQRWTLTSQAPPQVAPLGFAATGTSSVTLQWSSTFPGGTLYYAQVSTSALFAAPLTSSNTFALTATFSGLAANSTYYAQVATAPGGPFTSLGSTVTWVQSPTSVYFDEVSSHSVVVSAYAPTPAFTNLHLGLSGTNVARDGVYAGWHGESWTTRASLATARYALAAAPLNGRLYALGGYNLSIRTENAEYDPAANAWTSKAAQPVPLLAQTAVAVDDAVLVSGGDESGGPSTFHRRYSPKSNSWTTLSAIPAARTGHGAARVGGRVYLFGGANPALTATAQSYSLSAGTWSAQASMPQPIQAMGFGVVRDRIYSLGGFDTAYPATTYEFDPLTNAWTTKAPMPTPRAWFTAASLGGKVYSFGGQGSTVAVHSANEEYDPAADAWAARLPLPTPRIRSGAAALGGRIYVVGGTNGTALSVNEAYDPGVAQVFTGLQPNTQYTFKAKARNIHGLETAETADVSTYTLAAVPLGATPTFTAAFQSSVTLAWVANGNPGGTEYRVHASTASDFNAAASAVTTAWGTGLTGSVTGLSGSTTYYFRVQARNAVGVETAFNGVGSTLTAQAQVLRVWDGGGVTNGASEAANWVGDVAPTAGVAVRFDPTSPKDCTWDLAITVAAMTLSAGYGGTVTLSTNVTVTGDLTASSGTLVAPSGGTVVTVQGRLVRTAPSAIQWSTGRLRLGGDLVLNAADTAAVATSTIEFNGSAYQVVYGTGSGLLPTLDVNSSSKVYFNRQGGGTWVAGGVRLRSGVLDFGGQFMFESDGDWLQTGGQFVAAQSTVIFVGGSTASPRSATPLPGNPFFNLRIGALPQALFPGHLRAAVPLDIDGSVIISSGSFDPSTFTHTVGGDWQHFGGDFLGSTGTVRLDGAATSRVVQLPGARFSALDVVKAATTTFPLGLSVSSFSFAQSGGALSFQAGSTVTVSRLILGAPGLAQRVRLRSTTAGAPWNLVVTGTATVARADVAESNASGGLTVDARLSDSLDSGNNQNWEFGEFSAGPFSAVFTSSLTASWGSNLGAGTLYYARLSTSPAFAAPLTSSTTLNLSATFSGLSANTTYYAQVATHSAGPFLSLGSTVTWVQAPTSVYFDEVTTHSIVASAYAPTPAFTNPGVGLSGTNLAKDGAYAGWHGERWTSRAAMPTARSGLAVGAIGGKLYAAGGYDGAAPIATHEEFDPAANVWTVKAAMPTPRREAAAGVVGDKLYVVGGSGGAYLATNEAYDPATNSWATKAAMPTARGFLAAVVLDGRVYAVGGTNAADSAANEAYDPATNSWTTKAPMPAARREFGAGASGGRLYAVGGWNGVTNYATNEEYSPAGDAWAAKTPLPAARRSLTVATLGGKLYAIGGYVTSSTNTVEEYDPQSASWVARAPMPTARHLPAAAVVGGRIHVLGGYNASPSAANEAYDPGVAQQFAGLQPNTQYAFKAKARNLAGIETAETASFSTYTLAAVPTAPSVTSVGTGTFTLQWSTGGNPAGTQYQAEVSLSSSFTSPAFAGWTPDLTSAGFTGLSSGTTYHARVRARNALGIPSDYATTVSTRTAYVAPAGCAVVRDVAKAGAPYGTISAALAAVPASLTAETCVVVRDTATYVEQVTVSNKATNGFRLRIMADPSLATWPTVSPPSNSTAAVQVLASSVSLEGLRLSPAFPIAWGVQIASPTAFLTSILVQTTVTLTNAGIGLNSFGTMDRSTVSVANSRGVWSSTSSESDNLILHSNVTNTAFSRDAVTLAGIRNAVVGSVIHNTMGTAAQLGSENRLERSTATCRGLVVVSFASDAASVTVKDSYVGSDTAIYGLAMSGRSHSVTGTTVALTSTDYSFGAITMIGVVQSTLSKVNAYSRAGTTLLLASGAAWNRVDGSTFVSGGSNSAAVVANSSFNYVTASVFVASSAAGLSFNGSQSNTVVGSTAIGNGIAAAYLTASSQNLFQGCFLFSPTATALELRSGSNANIVQQSRLVSKAAAAYGLYLTTASGNSLVSNLVENTAGYAAFLGGKADGNLIDLSTVTAVVSGYSALYLDNAATNTFTRSYFANLAGTGVTFGAGASSNTLSMSTVAASGAAAKGLHMFMAADSAISDSWLLGGGYPLYTEFATRALVLRSTVSSSGSVPAAMVAGSSGVVLRDSYVGGSDAVTIYSSTATTLERTVLRGTGGSAKALQFLGGSNGLWVSSAALSASSFGIVIEDGARGPIALSSFSVSASTGLQFQGGTQVATVSLAGFLAGTGANVDASGLGAASRVTMRDAFGPGAGTRFENDPLSLVDWNPDASPVISAGPFSGVSSEAVTASWTSGYPPGTQFIARLSTDAAFLGATLSSATLNSAATFSGLSMGSTYYAQVATAAGGPFTALGSTRTRFGDLPGCATSKFVQKAGGADCVSLGACVALIPATPLAGDFCIAVLDSAVYAEQVTVAGKNPNGFRIRLWGAGGARPTVNPPSGSSAGFRLLTASVSVSDINVVTTNTVTYGVLASSASVSLSSMILDSGGRINGAGVFLSSWGVVQNASVTVQNADGFRLTGPGNVVTASSAAVTVFGRAAFYLGSASSNTVSDSYGSGNPGYGAFVYRSHGNTFARTTLRKLSATAGAAGLYMNDASSNTVTGCFISNAGGPGADLSSSVNYNLIELSTVTAAGNVYTALELGFGRGNRVSRVYAHSDAGNAFTLSSAMSESLVENSTFSTYFNGAAALSTNGSSDTLTGNMLYAPNGIALALNGSSITVSRTAGYTATPSYSAFYVGSGGLVTVRDSSFENAAGDGGRVERASYVDILRSTLTAAGGGAALKLQGASSNTVTASRLAAPGGVGLAVGSYLELFDMTTTTGSGNAFSGLSIVASTAVSLGAAPGLELSSSALTGDAQGAAVAFGDAVLVATFTGLAFPSGAAWSAEATLLPAGSRITIRDPSGPQGGSLYENDPLSLVDWVPDLVPFVLPSAPAAPSGTVLGVSSISWTWAAVANAQSYRVYSSSSGSLLGTSASTGVVITDLLPATTHSVVVAGVARGADGPLSPSATAHTHASPPTGLSLDFLFVSSAALSWSLEDNPWQTQAELQRSTDGASYVVRAGTLASSAEDTGLLGCTSYYYRVRHKSPAGVGSPFDGPLLVRTAASTPSAPGELSAQSVPGRRVSLTWTGSATEGVLEYRLYKDTGAGTVDYTAPYAVFGPSVRSTTTVALSTGAIHLFGLRAFHRCGVEEKNTHAVASAWALETLDGVRASIKVPATGKKISGNRVLVMAELDTGSSSDVSTILFQYRSTGSATWTDVPAANVNHPNPDREQPFFVHWDVSALADRAYDLRAVASDVAGASDPAPGTITVLVDSVSFEVKETDLGGGKVKKEQAVSNETSNTVATAESGSAVVTKVILPAGALNTSDATLSATANPAALPPPPAAATSLGASIEITLSNGQSLLSNGQTAAIVFNYPDDNGDGVIDGTSVRAENAEIQTFDVPTNKWKKEFATTVDRDKKTLTGFTPHFSLFAAFGVVTTGLDQIRVYPNPYKPNAGNPDEGRTFSRADPLSGVVFDNLPSVVDIKIYTLTGRLVSSFGTTAGTGAVQWDGKNDQGEDVASGGYFAVITSPGAKTVVKKLAVIR